MRKIPFPLLLAAIVLAGVAVTIIIQITVTPAVAVVWPGDALNTDPSTGMTITVTGSGVGNYSLVRPAIFGSGDVIANYTIYAFNVTDYYNLPPVVATSIVNTTVTDPNGINVNVMYCPGGIGVVGVGGKGWLTRVLVYGGNYIFEPIRPVYNTTTTACLNAYANKFGALSMYIGSPDPSYYSLSGSTLTVYYDSYSPSSSSATPKAASSSITVTTSSYAANTRFTLGNKGVKNNVLFLYPGFVYISASSSTVVSISITPK